MGRLNQGYHLLNTSDNNFTAPLSLAKHGKSSVAFLIVSFLGFLKDHDNQESKPFFSNICSISRRAHIADKGTL